MAILALKTDRAILEGSIRLLPLAIRLSYAKAAHPFDVIPSC